MASQNAAKQGSSSFNSWFAGAAIILCLIIGHLVFHLIMGNGSNFEGSDNANHPLPGNYLGIVYKGGPIVPILMSFFLIVLTVSLERFFTLSKANGTGSIESFVLKIDRKSTRLNSSHSTLSRMPSSA